MDGESYHLLELRIATNPLDPRRVMPTVLRSHRRVLDVGCGAGQTLVASDLASDVVAVGVDLDMAALSLGTRLSQRINFVCAAGEALPLRGEYFDLVISRVAVPYMHTRSAVTEMWRVLRGGGCLWLVLHPGTMPLKKMVGSLLRLELKDAIYRGYVLINGLVAHLSGKELRSPFGKRGYESFQTSRSITRVLKDVGFDNISIECGKFFVVRARKPRGSSFDRRREF